jgi:hypothetical protein
MCNLDERRASKPAGFVNQNCDLSGPRIHFSESFRCNISAESVLVTCKLLGAFAKLRKATTSVFMSVCLSVRPSLHFCPYVRMEQLGSDWADFHEI